MFRHNGGDPVVASAVFFLAFSFNRRLRLLLAWCWTRLGVITWHKVEACAWCFE
jgi:hypothetical protein